MNTDHDGPDKAWIAVFGFIALVFNPIIKFHLGRELWMALDLVACMTFMANYVHVGLHRHLIPDLKGERAAEADKRDHK